MWTCELGGWDWLNQLGLPETERKVYVMSCKFLNWDNRSRSRVLMSCPLIGQRFLWKNSDARRHGMVTLMLDGMVLVDKTFSLGYPQVLFGSGENPV